VLGSTGDLSPPDREDVLRLPVGGPATMTTDLDNGDLGRTARGTDQPNSLTSGWADPASVSVCGSSPPSSANGRTPLVETASETIFVDPGS